MKRNTCKIKEEYQKLKGEYKNLIRLISEIAKEKIKSKKKISK